MAIIRLTGGDTPANGGDPRTFPAIWNAAADDIEAAESDIDTLQSDVITNANAVSTLETRVEDIAFGVETLASDTIVIDFAEDEPFLTRTLSGTSVDVSAVNYGAGVSKTLRLVGGASAATVTVDSDWVFVGAEPSLEVPANGTVIVALTSYGTSAVDVVGAWAETV